jgi:DNA-directed RNA polymerase specialized sigma24 family protein
VPPFGIQESGDGGRSIHPRVLNAARQLWKWAYVHVDVVLHDAPAAAELLEQVAIQVSARLESEREVDRNLKGYLIAAFHNHVRRELIKANRFTYVGLLRELEEKHPLLASDFTDAVEFEIFVNRLTALMPEETQRIVRYRLLDFTWKEIGNALGILASQARNKYYYGVKTALERLVANAAKRRRREE